MSAVRDFQNCEIVEQEGVKNTGRQVEEASQNFAQEEETKMMSTEEPTNISAKEKIIKTQKKLNEHKSRENEMKA